MIRTLLVPVLLLVPLSLLSMMLVGCQRAAETPPEATQTAAPQQSEIDALVTSYLELREDLAQDRSEQLTEQLAEIQSAAQSLTDSDNPQVTAQAETIVERASAAPEDIKQAREVFKSVSAALVEIVAVEPPSDDAAQSLYVAYCPMAKAQWLQTTQEVSNPYMGQEMPKCGEIQETVKPTKA